MEGMLPPLVAFLVADIGQFKLKMAEAGAVAEATTAGTASKFQMLAGAGKVAMIATAASVALVSGAAFELEKHAEEAGQAAFEMTEKFGLSGKQASTWVAIGAQVGVEAGQVSNAFRFLTRNMENVNLSMKANEPSARAVMESSQKLQLAQAHYNDTLKAFGPHSAKTQTAMLALEHAQDAYNKVTDETARKLSPAGQALRELGIQVFDTNGKLRSANDVMHDAVVAFGKMEDGPEKAGLAMKVFGRSGQNLLPLLNAGADGLDKMTKSALASGAVMSNEQVKGAHAAFLAHKQFDQAVNGLAIQLGASLLPVMTSVFGWLSGTAVPAIREAIKWTKEHTEVVKIVAAAIAGPLLLAIGAYIVSMTIAAATTLAAMWPILLIIAALALVGVAIYLVVSHWKEISAFLMSTWKTAVDWAGASFGWLAERIGSFFNGILTWANKAWSDFSSRPFYWLTRLSVGIPVLLSQLIGHVVIWGIGMLLWANKAGHDFWAAVGDWLNRLIPATKAWLLGMLQEIITGGIAFVKKFEEITTNIRNTIFNGGNWIALGTNIIEGIKSGIINGVTGLLGTVRNVGGQIVAGFKDALGIHSPSSIIAAQVGMPIAQGVAVGILGQSGAAAAAMKSLVAGVVGAGTGSPVLALGYAGTRGGASSGGSQTNGGGGNTFNANFYGPVADAIVANRVITRLQDEARRKGLLNGAGIG